MRDLGMIDAKEFQTASGSPVAARKNIAEIEVDSPHLAEMVRSYMINRYGEDAYQDGYRVFTTVSSDYQNAANEALRSGLMSYDRRHGFRGPVRRKISGKDKGPTEILGEFRSLGNIVPAVVSGATPDLLDVVFPDLSLIHI